MIYTRYGSPVTIESPIDDDGWVWVKAVGEPKRRNCYQLLDLKADNGLAEIQQAADVAFKAGKVNEDSRINAPERGLKGR